MNMMIYSVFIYGKGRMRPVEIVLRRGERRKERK
jgi:hypothetical protein